MTGAQVPLWVPLIVAFIGTAGVIIAQLIHLRRERLRTLAEREYNLETVAAQRSHELEVATVQRNHELKLLFREERKQVYLDIMLHIETWQELSRALLMRLKPGGYLDSYADSVDELWRRNSRLLAQLLLLAPYEISNQMYDFTKAARGCESAALRYRADPARDQLELRHEWEACYRPLYDMLFDSAGALQNKMRDDLQRIDDPGHGNR